MLARNELPLYKTDPRRAQVYLLDHARFSRPGPRLVDGVEALARIFHPQLVTTPLPDGVAMRLCLPPNTRCRPHQLRQYFQPYN